MGVAGIGMRERTKVVLDVFRSIGFEWTSIKAFSFPMNERRPTDRTSASVRSSQSVEKDTPDIEPRGFQALDLASRDKWNVDSF